MNEVYSSSVSKKIIIFLLFVILLLSFYSSGLPFYYIRFLFTLNTTALNFIFLPLRFIFIIYILFSIVKKRIPYMPFLIIFFICGIFSIIKNSIQLDLFLNIFCIYGLFSIIYKKAYYKDNRILFFIVMLTLCPFIMTTKSFDIELFKFVIFEISLLFIFLLYIRRNIPIQKNNFDYLVLGYLIYNFLLVIIHKFTLISI